MVFHRLDHISNIRLSDRAARPLRQIPGYESGIDYKKISAMPYMYTDEPERIEFTADAGIVDQIIDWFGKDITIQAAGDPEQVIVSLYASPYAMKHWALQYLDYVEVLSPAYLRERIRECLSKAREKYQEE